MSIVEAVSRRLASPAMIAVAFALLACAVYLPALQGDWVSDDIHYVRGNGYVQELDRDHLLAILDPTGPLIRVVENYAPVHLLLHAVAWQLFHEQVLGHHLVNVALHALASWVLFLLFRRCGISHVPAMLGAAFFLLHPANVEAVAWISQLKTTSAMVLMLGALLAHPAWPALALALFVLALLAKPTAAAGLFVVAALGWSQGRAATSRWRWPWLAGWAAALVAFSAVELLAFAQTAGTYVVQVPEWDVRVRTMFAVAARYLAMAVSSYGVSAFQEPPPATSWLDPWWLSSLVALGALGWRALSTLRARRVEAAFWVWALVSFAPVSGMIPLPHIMADRYLYFMLPGLVGGTLLLLGNLFEAWAGRGVLPDRAMVGRACVVLAVVWIAALASRSYAQAFVWQSEASLTANIVANYPEGRWALVERAGRAVERGERDAAVSYLRRAREKGFSKLDLLLSPRYAPLRGHPAFDALLVEVAREWIARVKAIEHPSQYDLMFQAQAYIVLGDFDAVRDCLRRGIVLGGPMTDHLYGAIEQLEQVERAAKAAR